MTQNFFQNPAGIDSTKFLLFLGWVTQDSIFNHFRLKKWKIQNFSGKKARLEGWYYKQLNIQNYLLLKIYQFSPQCQWSRCSTQHQWCPKDNKWILSKAGGFCAVFQFFLSIHRNVNAFPASSLQCRRSPQSKAMARTGPGGGGRGKEESGWKWTPGGRNREYLPTHHKGDSAGPKPSLDGKEFTPAW